MNKYNQMTDEQKSKFWDWMKSNSNHFDGKTTDQIAKLASKELSIKVTKHNVIGAAKIHGISWKKPTSQGSPNAILWERLKAAENRLDEIEKRLGRDYFNGLFDKSIKENTP